MCLHGRWGTVCDDQWGKMDAQVACDQLGYEQSEAGGVAYPMGSAFFGEGDGLILLDDLECVGNETSLLECVGVAVGIHNCDNSEDAGVYCPST